MYFVHIQYIYQLFSCESSVCFENSVLLRYLTAALQHAYDTGVLSQFLPSIVLNISTFYNIRFRSLLPNY